MAEPDQPFSDDAESAAASGGGGGDVSTSLWFTSPNIPYESYFDVCVCVCICMYV